MQFNRTSRIFILAIAATAVIALLLWAFIEGRREFAAEQERERPVKATSRVRFGETGVEVKIDTSEQVKAGIVSQTLSLSSHQQQFKTYGTIVPAQQLADAFQSYASAKAQATKANATAAVSRKEYLRTKDLYERKLESDKIIQTAEADWRSDDATAQAAESARLSLESSIRQQWGETTALWAFTGSAELHKILNHQNVLVEVTLSADEKLPSAPRTAIVQLSINERSIVRASFVSTAQSADARFQGSILFYVAPSSSNALLGGMNVNVFLPAGEKKEGIVVPRSAAVWWQGKVWMYAKKSSDTFVRTELPIDQPMETGWFVAKDRNGFSDSMQVVVRGVQLLLSEEFRSQIQVGEEGEKQ
ncbi:hypothetical protein D4R75_05305 [bacterium]|nr:MAG: hypothetical protein D4R75_05305 [bacterium]